MDEARATEARRLRIFLWLFLPAMGAVSLWGYLAGGGGQDKFRNAVVLAGLGLVVMVAEEVRARLRR
jgi:hypothetical protein